MGRFDNVCPKTLIFDRLTQTFLCSISNSKFRVSMKLSFSLSCTGFLVKCYLCTKQEIEKVSTKTSTALIESDHLAQKGKQNI